MPKGIFNPLRSLSLRRRDFPGSRQTLNNDRAGAGPASRLRYVLGIYAFGLLLFRPMSATTRSQAATRRRYFLAGEPGTRRATAHYGSRSPPGIEDLYDKPIPAYYIGESANKCYKNIKNPNKILHCRSLSISPRGEAARPAGAPNRRGAGFRTPAPLIAQSVRLYLLQPLPSDPDQSQQPAAEQHQRAGDGDGGSRARHRTPSSQSPNRAHRRVQGESPPSRWQISYVFPMPGRLESNNRYK